ncbi:MAG: hypothetical protein CM1200mP40_13410 [Gammaproteobacteria bacterium]|nr:MAG: hypothetical protein CM1200mP40_13410 [Gammaproteobacteria bacterium]
MSSDSNDAFDQVHGYLYRTQTSSGEMPLKKFIGIRNPVRFWIPAKAHMENGS